MVQTWLARSWYCFFSSGFKAYHHSPRILLTDRLSWLGCRWCTSVRWRLLNIMKAFIGRRTWSRRPSFTCTMTRQTDTVCEKLKSSTCYSAAYVSQRQSHDQKCFTISGVIANMTKMIKLIKSTLGDSVDRHDSVETLGWSTRLISRSILKCTNIILTHWP